METKIEDSYGEHQRMKNKTKCIVAAIIFLAAWWLSDQTNWNRFIDTIASNDNCTMQAHSWIMDCYR
jgi:hypothetical protein